MANLISVGTYAQAQKLCSHPRYPNRKLGRQTYMQREGDDYVVRQWGHPIVTYQPDGGIRLDSCGYRTATTKDRLNQLVPGYHIWSERGTWWIAKGWWNQPGFTKWAFADGMVVYPDRVEGAASEQEVKERRALRKRVSQYAKDYVRALFAGEVGKPDNGDCWGCLMKDEKTGRPVFGTDHLLQHFDEKYYVPSLLWNAGHAETAKLSIMAKYTIQQIWDGELPNGDRLDDFMARQIKDTIEDYLLRELGLG